MNKKPALKWKCRRETLTLQGTPLLMGILNVTPDSFSDGGEHLAMDDAVNRGLEMAGEGADIIDIGGESTRPGSHSVSAEEEAARVIPVIRRLSGMISKPLSIDTMKATVAEQALKEGASIINDVSGLTHDKDMPRVAAESGAGVVVMHMQGTPANMQKEPVYSDVVREVTEWLGKRLEALAACGIAPESIAVDPGIGFGKTYGHNIELLNGISDLAKLNRPVIIGLSRKSFLGRITGRAAPERVAASISALVFCTLEGAHIMRVHDVSESRDAVNVLKAVSQCGENDKC